MTEAAAAQSPPPRPLPSEFVGGVPCLSLHHDAHLEHFFVTGGIVPPDYRVAQQLSAQEADALCRSGEVFFRWSRAHLFQSLPSLPVRLYRCTRALSARLSGWSRVASFCRRAHP